MDVDFRLFIARHVIDIFMVIIFGVKVLFVSKADFRTKFTGSILLFGVITLGQFLRTQMSVGADSSVLWSIAIAIGLRLIALKIIFTMIDAEP